MAKKQKLFTFYDPHPGIAGALAPIPKQVKAVADAVNGKTLAMPTVARRFRAAASKAGVEFETDRTCVLVKTPESAGYPQHVWLAIRFREVARPVTTR